MTIAHPEALLLDLGGVVLDIDPQGCFDAWASASGVDVEQIASRWVVDDAYKAFEVDAIDFTEYANSLSRSLGIALPMDKWLAGWNALLKGPLPEVVKTLTKVAARLPLYAFSNTNVEHQAVWQPWLRDMPFRKVYTSWEIRHRKPDVEAYLTVAADMGLAPGQILFVDDKADNIAGARLAGFGGEHVTRPAETLALLRRLSNPA